MIKNASLPKLKLSSELKNKVDKALNFINSNEEELEITLSQFRRMALKHFSDSVIADGLKINLKQKG